MIFSDGKGHNNLIVIGGAKGSGKTIAAVTAGGVEGEKKTLVFDMENSTASVRSWFQGTIVPAYERFGSMDAAMLEKFATSGRVPWASQQQKAALAGLWDWFLKELGKHAKQGFTTLVIDTYEPLEAALVAAVENDRSKFGWSGNTARGARETEAVRPVLEFLMAAIAAAGFTQTILTVHVKTVWMNDKPVPGKITLSGRMAVLQRLSSLMLWLVQPEPSNASGAPAALVMKARLERVVRGQDGHFHVQRVLPRRLPEFSWAKVAWYMENPANLKDPAEGEVPTEAEIEMMSPLLNNAQLRLMVLGAEADLESRRQSNTLIRIESTLSDEQKAQIAAKVTQGLSAIKIAGDLGLPFGEVSTYIQSHREVDEETVTADVEF